MGPTQIKNNKKKNKMNKKKIRCSREQRNEFFLFSLFFYRFSLRFTEFRRSEFVEINTKSALRDEGYA